MIAYAISLILSFGIALSVLFAALETQSSRILDDNGLAWPFALLVGPAAFGESAEQAWTAVITGAWPMDRLEFYRYLLRIHVWADFGFIVAYFILGLILALGIYTTLKVCIPLSFLWVAVAADLVENVAILAVSQGIMVNATFLVWVTRIKLAMLAMLVIALLVGVLIQKTKKYEAEEAPAAAPDNPVINRRVIGTAWDAVVFQRLSLLPAITFFVLSVTAGSPILEQLPDVQRGWVDGGLWQTNALWAVQAVVLVTAAVFVTTRVRLAFVRALAAKAQSNEELKPEPAKLRLWWIAPIVVALLAAWAIVFGHVGIDFWTVELRAGESDLHLVRFLIFVGVPTIVVAVSGLIRRRWRPGKRARSLTYRPYKFPPTPNVNAVAFVGNVATVALMVVAGLGLIRAFVPLVILGDQLETDVWLIERAWVWIGVGIVAVVGPWIALILLTVRHKFRRFGRRRSGSRSGAQAVRPIWEEVERWDYHWVGRVLLVCWVVIFLALAMSPALASDIGLAATAIFGIGALTGMISAMGLLMLDQEPAEIFQIINLQRTPYVTVLALTLVIVGLFSGAGTIHAVDRGAPITPQNPMPARTSLQVAFDDWVGMEDPCRTTVGNRSVRPMLLVAAEGGGIRATYWTVRSLEALGVGTCAGKSALFSSGASGGSVGLTVARFSGTASDPGTTRAVEAVVQMADDEILAAGADGMFTRDVFYGATGVPLLRLDVPRDVWTWHDRARLIEQGWAQAYDQKGEPWGTRSFLREGDLSPVTGHLVLNSTSVKGNCRVWVSQLALPVNSTASTEDTLDPEYSCDKVAGPGPRTIDLFSAYGPYATGVDAHNEDGCLGDVSAATAALLTARFPFVTPSGVVGPCPRRSSTAQEVEPYWPSTQLVDGGYIENSGLATISDLSLEWQSLIRKHNAKAADPVNGMDVIVPFVVYLSNGDVNAARPKVNQGPTSEASLPLITYLEGRTSLSGTNALLERAREAVQIDAFCPQSPECDVLDETFRRRVIVIDRLPKPEISAPLGWALSASTRETLDDAMDYQFTADCDDEPEPPTCRTGYAPLGELRKYFGAVG